MAKTPGAPDNGDKRRPTGIDNDHELRVVGMSRSGNHAVINWILHQARGRVCFLNCAEPKSNPFETARPMADGNRVWTNVPRLDLEAERRGSFSAKDYLIHSYEDCFLGMVANRDFERRRDALVGRSRRRIDVLILRDPFNLFASRWKLGHSQVSPHTERRIWKQHARQVLGERRYLPGPTVPVRYNDWFQDSAYRHDIATRLGLPFTDEGIDRVASTGGGSSFDARAYDGRPGRMKVLQRWRHFIDDPRYREMFDPELIELSRRIFGPSPAEAFLDDPAQRPTGSA